MIKQRKEEIRKVGHGEKTELENEGRKQADNRVGFCFLHESSQLSVLNKYKKREKNRTEQIIFAHPYN